MSALDFPDGFLWGAATAAHQVEGANANNDWWDWEQTPGHIQNGDTSVVACDWWKGERYREDFDLAASLNQNAHRLSVEWSRIEPREGEWNADAIAFYRRVLGALRERKMTPLITLHHFANPRWLIAKGAWETEAVVSLFERYAAKVVQELGDLCDFWVTINEPFVYAYSGYSDGNWPPGKKDFFLTFRVLANMVRGHVAAYHAIHRVQPHARVGVAHHLIRFLPANEKSRLDKWAASLRDQLCNRLFFRALIDGKLRFPMRGYVPEAIGTQDFIGVNYYFAERSAFDVGSPGQLFSRGITPVWHAPVPSFAGEINPIGFYDFLRECFEIQSVVRNRVYTKRNRPTAIDFEPTKVGFAVSCSDFNRPKAISKHSLREYAAYGKPIYVTENGLFDLGDETQARYLVLHLVQVQRAIAGGVPVKGYFYWTLVDNFEWAEGFTARFGLYHLDVPTQKRTPRPSAEIYKRIACDGRIADELIEKYGHTD